MSLIARLDPGQRPIMSWKRARLSKPFVCTTLLLVICTFKAHIPLVSLRGVDGLWELMIDLFGSRDAVVISPEVQDAIDERARLSGSSNLPPSPSPYMSSPASTIRSSQSSQYSQSSRLRLQSVGSPLPGRSKHVRSPAKGKSTAVSHKFYIVTCPSLPCIPAQG